MFVEYFFNEINIPLSIIFTGQHSHLCCHHIVHTFSGLIATCTLGFFHKSDFHNSEQFSPAVIYTVSKVAVTSARRLSLMTESRSLLDSQKLFGWLVANNTYRARLRGRQVRQLLGTPSYEGCWDIVGIIGNVVLITTWKNVSVNYTEFWHAPSEILPTLS